MHINRVDIQNVRNLLNISFESSHSINYFCGPNGAGKSSILEAIYLLSCGRSYRTHLSNELINWNSEELIIRAEFSGDRLGVHQAGLSKVRNKPVRIRLDRKDLKSASQLARSMPVKVIHPDMHELIRGGPSMRRKFIDWGVFHVEREFLWVWKRYQNALKQRNILLKSCFKKEELEAWTRELAEAGESLHQLRQDYLSSFVPVFEIWVERFSLYGKFEFDYQRGWEEQSTLLEALNAALKSCIKYRTTTIGPHRADMVLRYESNPAKQGVSRGQQKLLIYALVFSQMELYKMIVDDQAVLLCDDPAAELDSMHLQLVIELVKSSRIQCFLTGNNTRGWELEKDDRMFHVERGRIQTVT